MKRSFMTSLPDTSGAFLTASVVLVIYAVLTMFYTTATTVSNIPGVMKSPL